MSIPSERTDREDVDATPLRCESRPWSGAEHGAWRWSLAAIIVVAALLDALWLVPAQQSRRAQPQPQQARPTLIYEEVRWRECRKATLRREIAQRQAELEALGPTPTTP